MSAALDALVAVLDLEPIEENIFRGRSPQHGRQRVFGGQVAGQALVAAGRTVPAERPVHSLHAYFLRPGDPAVPIVYEVDRIRDGRSFATRRVVAVQHGQPIFNMSASFHADEPGLEHSRRMPEVPDPESLATATSAAPLHHDEPPEPFRAAWPFDLRYVGDPPWVVSRGGGHVHRQRVWLRADGRLPDAPLLHVCALTYASDLTLLDSVLQVHGLSFTGMPVNGASLDHAVWFHRPFRADEWLLYDQEAPSAHGGRGLARGEIFSATGQLVASVVQEGLLRVVARAGSGG